LRGGCAVPRASLEPKRHTDKITQLIETHFLFWDRLVKINIALTKPITAKVRINVGQMSTFQHKLVCALKNMQLNELYVLGVMM
jgi:hypothetical protein